MGIENGCDHLMDCVMDQAVEHRGDGESSLAGVVKLIDQHFSDRLRLKRSVENLFSDRGGISIQVAGKFFDGHPIEAGRAAILSLARAGALEVIPGSDFLQK